MTKKELESFLKLWRRTNAFYSKHYPRNHIAFPEPLQKEIVMRFFDTKLKPDSNKTYDFVGNVELKSSTKSNGGCTPFKSNQNNCQRIIYMTIGDKIDIYELNKTDVQTINNLITNNTKNKLNISLKQYINNATSVISI